MVLERLRPVSVALVFIYLAFIPYNAFELPVHARRPVVLTDVFLVFCYGTLALLLRRDAIRHRFGHVVMFGCSILALTSVLQMYVLVGEGLYTHYVIIIMLATASIMLSAPWLVAVLLFCLAGWGAVALDRSVPVSFARLAGTMLAATAVSFAIHHGRLHSRRQLIEEMAARRETEADLRRANRLLEELSRLDPLTELVNRRVLVERLDSETQRTVLGHPLTLLVLDLDGFKAINDEFGHAAGDDTLRRVASILRQVTRAYDVVGRLGGDEFFAILPNTNDAAAHHVVVRLIEQIRTTGTARGKVTASVGVAQAHAGETPMQLLRRADEAAYRAKHAGGDRWEISEGGEVAERRIANQVASLLSPSTYLPLTGPVRAGQKEPAIAVGERRGNTPE